MRKLHEGEIFPDFPLMLAFEGEKMVHDILSKQKFTIFWFMRYLGCTFCNYDIHQIAEQYSIFRQREAQVVIVLQSRLSVIEEELEGMKHPAKIVCDPECLLYDSLNIPATATKEERMPKTRTGIEKLEGKRRQVKAAGYIHGKYEGREQQLPAIFIMDEDGIVRYAHYAENSIDMPEIDDIADILTKLTVQR